MKKLISILSAFLLCAFAYGANVYTNSFVRDGVTYVQRGVLTVKDYVVTNVVGGGGGGAVNSVNGKTGDVVLNAQDVGALPINNTDQQLNFGILTGTGISLTSSFYDDDYPGMVRLRFGGASYFGRGLNVQGSVSISNSEIGLGSGELFVNGTNVMDAISGAGKVKSVNGETGDVVVSEVNSATNWINKPWWIEDNYAIVANEANFANEAGRVPWGGIEEKPDWIGNSKPTYTASEVGAAPAKTTLVLGGTIPNYELRLNGVAQTFDQVSNYVAHGEVIAKHLNGFYKPTYISASEIMFDCTGFIAGDVSTRRIHMVKTNNKVVLDDTKVLAEEKWVLGLSTTYALTNQIVALNQSVQYVTSMGGSITPLVPANVPDGVRDWVIYVNAVTDTQLNLDNLPSVYVNDASVTNNLPANKVTALYITEILKDKYMLGRQELIPVK